MIGCDGINDVSNKTSPAPNGGLDSSHLQITLLILIDMLSMEFEKFARGLADRRHSYTPSLIAVQPFIDLGVLDVRRDVDREIVIECDKPLVEGPLYLRWPGASSSIQSQRYSLLAG